jgi:hypothetical protein
MNGLGQLRIVALQSHGTWEHIQAAVANGRWLALLSTTKSMTTSGKYISIVDLTNFREQWCLGQNSLRTIKLLNHQCPDTTARGAFCRMRPLLRSLMKCSSWLAILMSLRSIYLAEKAAIRVRSVCPFADTDSVLIAAVDDQGSYHFTLIAGIESRSA